MAGTLASKVIAGFFVVFFIASRPLLAFLVQQPKYDGLLSQMHERRLTDEETVLFVKAGIPALKSVLDDFRKDDFFRRTGTKITPEFNLGRAMDSDTYVRNVASVCEAFGPIGVDQLVMHLPVDLVKRFSLDTPEFYALGTGTIKPLLAVQVLGKLSPDQARVWVSQWTDQRRITEINPDGAMNGFWVDLLIGIVASAVWDGLKWLYHQVFGDIVRPGIPSDYFADLLSPSARNRALLRQLNPEVVIPNIDQGMSIPESKRLVPTPASELRPAPAR